MHGREVSHQAFINNSTTEAHCKLIGFDKHSGHLFLFGKCEGGTDVRTEFIAGITTFLTMVYIVFVNPQILGNAGMDKGAVFVATCIAAAVSTLVMALYANYPIALAPGMGLNAFFAFTVVLTYKYTWQQALAAVRLALREYVSAIISASRELSSRLCRSVRSISSARTNRTS